MSTTDFTPAFGRHEVPIELELLAMFAAECKSPYSGRFKLAPLDATAWLSGRTKKADQFALFGKDPDGSLYGFWLYGERTPANAPIVYLNADHEGNTVLAASFAEFLSLLALDIADLGIYVDDPPRDRKHGATNLAFCRWLEQELGIVAAPQPARLVQRARAAHPDLDAWLGKRPNPGI